MPISIFPRSMNIWNRLPCSAVSHVIPFLDNFHKFAIPAIRVLLSFKFHIIFFIFLFNLLHIVNNSVLVVVVVVVNFIKHQNRAITGERVAARAAPLFSFIY